MDSWLLLAGFFFILFVAFLVALSRWARSLERLGDTLDDWKKDNTK